MAAAVEIEPGARRVDGPRVASAPGGGGACGLAHLNVLEILETEGIRPAFLAGTSIGGLVAALAARVVPVGRVIEIAQGFRFPRYFIPGRVLGWHEIFPTAVHATDSRGFGAVIVPEDPFAPQYTHSGCLVREPGGAEKRRRTERNR